MIVGAAWNKSEIRLASRGSMATRIGIDTGGTFTDVARWTQRGLKIYKVPSTPDDPAVAVLQGLALARRDGEEVDVVHGTTVGINAMLTGNVARTAFVTTAGFEDLIEVARQDRRELYALEPTRAELPVPRELRFGVACRRKPDGSILQRLEPEELSRLRNRLARAGVESIAIGLLHSPTQPADEKAIARALTSLGVPITCSATLLPAMGEFERFAAAIINAAISPVMGNYLTRLHRDVRPGRLRLMRSSLGIMPAVEAVAHPARAVFSGPAGGVLATRQLARACGFATTAALDMGGTSSDVALVEPSGSIGEGSMLAGLPLHLPSVEVHTVGCGGGSIAYVDAGGALRVGPQSAGADPGPACYGRGDEATVTDAHMALGHMGADTLLQGEFPVDVDRSVRAIERLARRASLSPKRTAEGILEVAEVNMMRALLVITVERAVDPAAVPLVAFGGAGGLHAAGLARRLQMPRAIVPADPGAFSAVGLALAGESEERILPLMKSLAAIGEKELLGRAAALANSAREDFRAQVDAEPSMNVVALLRYTGQGPGLAVPCRPGLAAAFKRLHQHRFGFLPEGGEIEAVELRARAERSHRRLKRSALHGTNRARPSFERRAPLGGRRWKIYRRQDLSANQRTTGPCLIEEHTAVTLVPEGCRCEVTEFGLGLVSGGR